MWVPHKEKEKKIKTKREVKQKLKKKKTVRGEMQRVLKFLFLKSSFSDSRVSDRQNSSG